MSYVHLSEGGFQVVYPLACGPGSLELSKSYMDMASKLFTFTFTFTLRDSGAAMDKRRVAPCSASPQRTGHFN